MPVKTHIDQAQTRVEAEQDAADAKLEGFETFIDRVSDLSTEPTPSSSPGITAMAGAQLHGDSSADDRCRTVRTAFEKTIQPHSVADINGSESLLATIQNEFTDSIAVALAPTTEPSFSPDLKRMIIAEANARQTETGVLRQALKREEIQLENAGSIVDDITAWIAEADETPLTALGFEALQHTTKHSRITVTAVSNWPNNARDSSGSLRTNRSKPGFNIGASSDTSIKTSRSTIRCWRRSPALMPRVKSVSERFVTIWFDGSNYS